MPIRPLIAEFALGATLTLLKPPRMGIAIRPGVQLNDLGADAMRGFNLALIRSNED